MRTRTALLTSAAEGFAREGFHVASLTDISRRAGVSNGALHFHFANKAALAAAVEEEASLRLTLLTRGHHGSDSRDDADRGDEDSGSRDDAGGGGPDADGPVLQHLVDSTHALARALRGDGVLRGGFCLTLEPAYPSSRDLHAQWGAWVQDALERARRAGELADTVTPQDAGATVIAATIGTVVLGVQHPDWLSRQSVTRFWRLVLPRLARTGTAQRVRAEGGAPRVAGHLSGATARRTHARL
ncbi:helix-turn-helix domain-containing protein [Streptomyces sp. NPDC001904]|uniref:helix-turn-helix domain-containing protein n=1 Tax=Streptomyces sp. NPDC001904 TaxID=3154531 RepID=UPI0033187DBC